MNFLRYHDVLLSVLYEDQDILAIDKPYGYNAHTNDSKIEHSEFIQDGLIEIYEKHLGKKLHIIHRLDQTTTGVMIFGKSVESAKKYAEFFFHRQVKKTYWFLTGHQSVKSEFLITNSIIHKGRELEAKTELQRIDQSTDYELWEAHPLTGRNHQIRIHAKAAGIPILGDEKYEGQRFSFLCLHNRKIEFPNGIVLESEPPAYYKNRSLLNQSVLVRALFEIDRRQRFFSQSDAKNLCFRLVHNQNNSMDPGFTLDHLGPILVLNWYKEHWSPSDHSSMQDISDRLKKTILVRFQSIQQTEQESLVINPDDSQDPAPEVWNVFENEVAFEMHSSSGKSAGLFLNQRLQRAWVKQNAEDKSVLSLFSYTGGYSVAAAHGGSREVTSVDGSKNALNWTRRNFEINGLEQQNHKFLYRDSITFLEQCVTKNLSFDIITCDAPSFIKREKGVFKIKTDLDGLIKKCLTCLNPGGSLLFSTAFDGFYIDDVRKSILSAKAALKIKEIEISNFLPSLDYELPDDKANLKSFLIKIGS